MRERFPYFAFWPSDFVNDLHVVAMTTEQIGAYLLLLCRAWQADPPGSLPNDDAILSKAAGVDAETWAEIKAGVLAPFKTDEEGRLYSKRLREEYEAASARSEQGTKLAMRRWNAARNPAASAPAMVSEQIRTDQIKEERASDPADQTSSCSVPSRTPAPSPAVLTIPVKGKSKEWALTEAKLAEYSQTFPGFDVLADIRKARQWCIDNPTKRKTNIPKFLLGWLNRTQADTPSPAAEAQPVRVAHGSQTIDILNPPTFPKMGESRADFEARLAKSSAA